MALVYRHDAEGGFTVGDTDTGNTSYAYPTSSHAVIATRLAARIASEMAASANRDERICPRLITSPYHARNWERLLAI